MDGLCRDVLLKVAKWIALTGADSVRSKAEFNPYAAVTLVPDEDTDAPDSRVAMLKTATPNGYY
jgi:hypothetical protein